MDSTKLSLERLCDPFFKVSSHYLIGEEGSIYQLVDEKNRAWHAGDSFWRGRSKVNDFSIGIEIQNPGHHYFLRKGEWFPYAAQQYQSLLNLLRVISLRIPLVKDNIVGHCHITSHRKIPKIDPGPHFDWEYLTENFLKYL